MSYTAVLRFQDTGGVKSGTTIQPIPAASAATIAKVLALGTSLHSYVNPGLQSYSLLEWTEDAVTGAVATATGSNCEKAQVNFSYVDANGDTKFASLWIPNPDMTHFEMVDGVGYRMKAASIALLEASLSTATGLTIAISEGKYEYREKEFGTGTKSESCLRFEDEIGNVVYMSVPLATDLAALVTFGEALNTDAFTKSILDRAIFLAQTDVITDPTSAPGLPASGTWDSVEARAYIKMQYVDGGRKKFMSVMLPGIKQANCELKPGKKGWKVKKVVGDGIALALTSFFGSSNRTLRYVSSKIDAVDLQAQ